VDVIILAREGLDPLFAKGQVDPASVVDLVRSKIAMAVRQGAPVPDISSVAAFKRTLLEAKSVAYSDSTSGVYLSGKLFKRLGIEQEMLAKGRMIPGTPVGETVARGEAEIGFQQYSELLPVAGIRIVGAIPEETQMVTVYAAAITSRAEAPAGARALIQFLSSPEAHEAITASGLEPVDQAGKPGSSSPAAVIQELAPSGLLRAAINLGNAVMAQRDEASSALKGVSVDLARELGRRLGVEVELVPFEAAGQAFEALKARQVDVAFLGIEPARAAEVDFSAPYVIIEATYMVRSDSHLKTLADVDQPGVRIAVGRGSAYDLYLTRTIRNATIVRAATGGGRAMIDLFLAENLEAVAGVRQQLAAYASKDPGLRIMADHFMDVPQAVALPPGQRAASAYVRAFVEQMKASGFVAAALERSGQAGARVAPPAVPGR
jgi:polar amino acid transport system substrate-binding protein